MCLCLGLSVGSCGSSDSADETSFDGTSQAEGEGFATGDDDTGGNFEGALPAPGLAPPAGVPTAPVPGPGQPAIVDVMGNTVDPVPDLDAEEEVLVPFELPAAGDRYVYAAIPESNSVAVIDADTLGIETIEAGQRPTYLQTIPGTDVAMVINTGSNDLTILRSQAGSTTSVSVDIVSGANALAVAPSGEYAIVYYDARRNSQSAGSFQDLSVVTLKAGSERSIPMTVGFRPSDVTFEQAGSRAFVVTEDGVSVLDLDEVEANGPFIADTLSLGTDAKALDVSVTPDGRYALARHEEESELRLLNLATRDLSTLSLSRYFAVESPDGGVPTSADASLPFTSVTDVDLSPNGDFALAVIRDRRSVLRLPIPDVFENPDTADFVALPTEIVGSTVISPDGKRALLYTTAQDDNERVSIYDIDEGTTRTLQLPKAVSGVSISPDAATALIIHQKLLGDPGEAGLDPDVLIDRSYGYSLLNMDTGFSKLQVTPVPLGATAIVPDSSQLFVLFPDPGLREVHRVGLESFLVDRFTLGSTPLSIGAVERANKVFITQDHADGRITFIDWDTAETESVTGFELNSRIRE